VFRSGKGRSLREMLYEVVLRFADRDEVRLHDRVLGVGSKLHILGREWVGVAFEPPARPDAAARIVLCEETALTQTDPAASRSLEVA
jgi:hypothetical protein